MLKAHGSSVESTLHIRLFILSSHLDIVSHLLPSLLTLLYTSSLAHESVRQ